MRGKENKASLPAEAKVLSIEGQGKEQNFLIDIVVVRLIFAVTLTLVAFYSHPFGFQGPFAGGQRFQRHADVVIARRLVTGEGAGVATHIGQMRRETS